MEKVIKELYSHTAPGLDGFRGKFYQTFKNKIISSKLFQSIEKEGNCPNSFYEAAITLTPELVKDSAKKKIKLQINIICEN